MLVQTPLIDTIDRRHVEDAFGVLDRHGILDEPWYLAKKSQLIGLVAAGFWAIGQMIPDMLPTLFIAADPIWASVCTWVSILVAGVLWTISFWVRT